MQNNKRVIIAACTIGMLAILGWVYWYYLDNNSGADLGEVFLESGIYLFDESPALALAAFAGVFGLLGVVIYISLSGNRKATKVTGDARDEALRFSPQSGMAKLYVYRTGFVAKLMGMDVTLDGRVVAQLVSPRFTALDLSPGLHRVTVGGSATKQSEELRFDAISGEVIVLKAFPKVGIVTGNFGVERIDLAIVRARLAKLKMVAPDVASA